MEEAALWFARANGGYDGTRVTNSIREDFLSPIPGIDSTIIKLGDYVRLITFSGGKHIDSLSFGDHALEVFFDGFFKKGKFPGDE